MKVKFLPGGEEHEIEFNETILHLAQREGIHIQSVCKGLPSCAECKIRIVDGEHHVLPPSSKEIALIGTAHYVDLSRLSCQLRCFGDVTVDLSEQEEKQARMLNKAKERGRRDGKESQAVLGSIVSEVPDDFDEDLDRSSDTTGSRRRPQNHKSLDNKDAFYGSFMGGKDQKKKKKNSSRKPGSNKKNRNSKNRGKKVAQAGGGNSGEGTGASGSGASKKKRRRRRKPSRPRAEGGDGG